LPHTIGVILLGMRRACAIGVLAFIGCARPTRAIVGNHNGQAAVHCPAPSADRLESARAPSWERDPLGRWPTHCIETDDGARVTITDDPTDPDGWRAVLKVVDGSGTRYQRDVRAIDAMAVAPDGGIVLAHVEDAVSRYAPGGNLMWKTPHPRCGAPTVSVGYDGRVVLGCGYSLVAFSPEGRWLWQKWPFGNRSLGQPLLTADGTIIVRSGGVVAGLDADGAVRWRVDTGFERYVLPLGARADGTLVFRTLSDGEPDPSMEELFVISRAGAIASRQPLDSAPSWPTTVPWTAALRSGRLP
jgi:hypothetical protein